MALQAAYKQFLAAPNATFLAGNASLHYITTLVTLNGSSEIIKHLNSQSHELKKNEEKVLDVVEGSSAIAAEVHTTLEFQNGGGAYLPKLDDNFLADRIVTFPIVCLPTCGSPIVFTNYCRFTLSTLTQMEKSLRLDKVGTKARF